MRNLQRSTRRLLTLTLALPALDSCTFLKLDEFSLRTCQTSDQCEVLNQDHGIAADACMRYQCSPVDSTCRLGARDADRDGDPAIQCGGHDCDEAIPTGAGPREPGLARGVRRSRQRLRRRGRRGDVLESSGGGPPLGTRGVQTVAYGIASTGEAAVAYASSAGTGASLALIRGSSAVGLPVSLAYVTNATVRTSSTCTTGVPTCRDIAATDPAPWSGAAWWRWPWTAGAAAASGSSRPSTQTGAPVDRSASGASMSSRAPRP